MAQKIVIAYFSGTGGAKRVAKEFEERFAARGCTVNVLSLDLRVVRAESESIPAMLDSMDRFLLIHTVHGFGAARPVHQFLNSLSSVSGVKAAVIPVSSSGEIWPNTASRIEQIKTLESKGFKVDYEEMLVMPTNCLSFLKSSEDVLKRIIDILPVKVERMIDEMLRGVERRQKKRPPFTGILKIAKKVEHIWSRSYGLSLKANDTCVGCTWCSKNCPVDNITMDGKKPVFSDQCIGCTRCVNGCPYHSIESKMYPFMALPGGFNIKKIERLANEKTEVASIEKAAPGLRWIGVRKYLSEE